MITAQQLVQETVRVINESPDYVYPKSQCSYLKDNCACLFGIVLSNLGLTQKELSKFENVAIGSFLFRSDNFAEDCQNTELRNWANTIQELQDMGYSWIQCLGSANENYPLLLKKYLN